MKIIVMIAFWLLYWFACFPCTGTDEKNLFGLRSYPDAVQKIVREHVSGKEACGGVNGRKCAAIYRSVFGYWLCIERYSWAEQLL